MDSTAAKSRQLFIFNIQTKDTSDFFHKYRGGGRIFDTRQGPDVFTLFNTNANNVQLNASLAPLQEGIHGLALQSSLYILEDAPVHHASWSWWVHTNSGEMVAQNPLFRSRTHFLDNILYIT